MIRLVVADDHPIVRCGLRLLAADEPDIDDVVGEAADGTQLLALLEQRRADVVCLDIAMPGRDGLAVLPDLRARLPRLGVLVLSMFAEHQMAMRTLRAGAHGYLSKQHAAEQLPDAIRCVAGGRRYLSPGVVEQLAETALDHAPEHLHERLSPREFAVLRLLGAGSTISEIAVALTLSPKTISTYRARILEKLEMRNNADIARYVVTNGLL